MADIRRIPFTEMVERVQKELVRDNSASEEKYKSRVNDEYTTTIPSGIDYRHIMKTASILTWADYSTGYVSATSTTTLTGTSSVWSGADAAWVAGTDDMLIKVDGYDEIYRATYAGATSITIDRSWVGTDISSSTGYVLYQDRYALPSDFDRLIEDPDECVYYWSDGVKVYLEYLSWGELQSRQTYVVGTAPDSYCVKWVKDTPYLYINTPTTSAMTIFFEYIPSLARMTEYTTGTITTLANSGTAVTGSGTAFDDYVTDITEYNYYFRIDGDGTGGASKWYKVTSAGSATALTLTDAYEGTAISTGTETFTICRDSLLPAGLDLAIVYGAALISAVDQDSKTQMSAWGSIYTTAVNNYKKKENTRGYGKQRIRTIYEKPGTRR